MKPRLSLCVLFSPDGAKKEHTEKNKPRLPPRERQVDLGWRRRRLLWRRGRLLDLEEIERYAKGRASRVAAQHAGSRAKLEQLRHPRRCPSVDLAQCLDRGRVVARIAILRHHALGSRVENQVQIERVPIAG